MNVVPVSQRPQTLCLLTAQTKEITPRNYLANVAFARNIKEIYDTRDRYPQNTCLLIEDDARMFSVWKSEEIVEHLVSVGRTRYREFRAKCGHEELA
jgi:hypothetical protein